MTSKIVVNNIEADTGVSTVTFGSKISSSEFVGPVVGNVTGNLTGTASTATAAATAYGLSGSPTLSGITSVSTSNLTVNGNAYPNAGPLSNRNKIINGDMRIDQRNAGASVTPTNGSFSLDRWKHEVSQTSKFTVQQSSVAPFGFSTSMLVTSSSAYSVGSSDYFDVFQWVEGFNWEDMMYGSSDARTATLSFWVRSSLTGTFGGSITNSTQNYSYPFEYEVSSADTWEYKTVTFSGATAGSWLESTNRGVGVFFGLGMGSTFSGTAGSWSGNQYYSSTGATSVVGTNGATWYITGVQLEVGSVATPFEHRSFGDELARCQRYYQKSYDYGTAPGSSVSQGTIQHGYTNMPAANYVARFGAQFRTSMRAQPTVVTYDTAGNSGKCNYPDTSTNQSFTIILRGENNFSAETSSLSNSTDARLYFHYTAEAEL